MNPFQPLGKTVLITAAVSAPTGVQIPAYNTNLQPTQFRIKVGYTAGGDVAIGWGATAADAATNAAIPGTTSQCLMFGPGQTEVLTFPPGSYFSAGIGASTAPVYISPGEGE